LFSNVSSSKYDTNDYFDNPEVTLKLEHAFGYGVDEVQFSPRGSLLIKNFKGPKYTTEQKEFSSVDFSKLKDVANKDGFYFIKANIKVGSNDNSFTAFVPADNLIHSGLSDIITLHLSPNGEISAVSYGATRNDYYSLLGDKRPAPQKFNTTLSVHHGESGPIPDTAPYLEKIEREKLAKERGDTGVDNRSFLAKYWMYIVPVLILVLLSGASNPEGGDGGGR